MRKVVLLYNPLSGSRHNRRLADVKAVELVLRSAGIEVIVAPTQAASGTAAQVNEAIAQGCDTVFACGGDGTVHDVLQSLVGSDMALAIIPLGTANALAHDLRIPLTAVGAARAALTAKPRHIAVGQVHYQDFRGQPRLTLFHRHSRYWRGCPFISPTGFSRESTFRYAGVLRESDLALAYAQYGNLPRSSFLPKTASFERPKSRSSLRSAFATSEECCANSPQARLWTATICVWFFSTPAAGSSISATLCAGWSEQAGESTELSWFTART